MELFRKPRASDFGWIHDLAAASDLKNADFSFCNIFCWDHTVDAYVGRVGDRLLTRLCLRGRTCYLYPAGTGDIVPAIEAMMGDAKEHGNRFVVSGVTREVLPELMPLFPWEPRVTLDESCSDYVYMATDLAELSGKRYHSKKNHVNRFTADHQWSFEPITRDNIDLCRQMAGKWFVGMEEERDYDYAAEAEAIHNALGIYFDVGFDGGVIIADGEPAAFTMGEMISPDTLNTHFEKADPHVNGAYAVINQEFARYMLGKYPGLTYINREEDMGIENLRRAKQSYHPAFMMDKFNVEWIV